MSGRVIARQNRELDLADAMPPDLRACVHEFGMTIVEVLLKHGVAKPSAIREVVRMIWEGARQPAQRLYGENGSTVLNKMDWVLIQANSPVSARTLARLLEGQSYVIAPRSPTRSMISASMSAIDGMGLLNKSEKHRIRLLAAMKAAHQEMWS